MAVTAGDVRMHLRAHRGWFGALLALTLMGVGCQSGDGSGGDGDPTGLSPKAQPCAMGEACPDGKVCDPLRGCVACLFDSNCASTEYCKDRECVDAIPCSSSVDCRVTSEPMVCDAALGRCAACVRDADCEGTAHCESGRCEPYEPCINTFDCTGNLVCNRAMGECVECVTAGDCGEGKTCWQSRCTPDCASDNDCITDDNLCDLDIGACVECVLDVDCPDVYHCERGSCVLDTCATGTTICNDALDGLGQCNARGDGADFKSCPADTTCSTSSGEAACMPHVCSPGGSACSDDRQSVEVCAMDGLSVARTIECAADEVCSGLACVEQLCEPGSFRCDGNTLIPCRETGFSEGTAITCAPDTRCDAEAGDCVQTFCVPGSASCDGSVVQTCNAAGAAYETTTDCADADQVCYEGACADVVCPPGGFFCQSGDVYLCNGAGTGGALYDTCDPFFGERTCVESVGTAACEVISCTPGDPICDGEIAGTCNDSGTGPGPGATDCAASGQTCIDGTCVDVVCDVLNQLYCFEGNVQRCVNQRTAFQIYDTCTTTEFCSETTSGAVCSPQVCTPGTAGCAGTTIGTCRADGSGFDATGSDCAQSGSACVNGTCLPIICEASTRYCDGGNVFACGSTGATSTLYDTCAASEHCYDPGTSNAYCRTDVCTSGAAVCRDNVATTCKADGSGPEDTGGTDCSLTSQACDGGQCRDIVCTADAYFCENGNVRLCNALGTGSSLRDTCLTTEHCVEGAATCVVDLCDQGLGSCNGETATTCLADGSGWAAGGTDCSATSEVCTSAQTCSATATDTVTSSSTSLSTSSGVRGNYYAVSTSRTLTQIEAHVSVTGTSLFTWVVYESTTETGSYTKVFEATTASSGTDVYHSSGAISVPLSQGKFYMIGVYVEGTHTIFRQVLAAQYVSFGRVFEGESFSGGAPTTLSYGSDSYLYDQRVTTAP